MVLHLFTNIRTKESDSRVTSELNEHTTRLVNSWPIFLREFICGLLSHPCEEILDVIVRLLYVISL